MTEHVLQTVTVTGVLATVALLLGRTLKIPTLLFFMVLGVLAGPSVLNLVDPASLGHLLMPFIELAVAIIIFEAALALPLRSLRQAPLAIRRMLTVTLPLTGIGAFLAARFLGGFSTPVSALFGSLIVVTGPTVINPLLKNVPLSSRVESVLRWESLWADCIGVLASGIVLELIIAPKLSGLTVPLLFAGQLGVGLTLGATGGLLLGRLILPFSSRLGDPGLPGIVALTSAIGLFFLANAIVPNSGVLTVAVAGFFTSIFPCRELDNIRHFKDQITTLVVAFLFVLLSAQIDFNRVTTDSWHLFAIAGLILFVIRPLSTIVGLRKTSLLWREKLYVGLVGPRGIISAAVASYYAIILNGRADGIDGMHLLVFVTIFVTGSFTSLLGKPLARLLKVSPDSATTGIILAGGGHIANRIATLGADHGRILIVDRNPIKVQAAMTQGLPASEDDILSDEFFDQMLEQGYRRILIMTPNAALNTLVSHKARRHLGSSETVMIATGNAGPSLQGATPDIRIIRLKDTIKAIEDEMAAGTCSIDWVDISDGLPENTWPIAWETRNRGLQLGAKAPAGSKRAICLRGQTLPIALYRQDAAT